MEQVSFRLHIRGVSAFCGLMRPRVRRLMEFAILGAALVSLGMMLILHGVYIHSSSTSPSLSTMSNDNDQLPSAISSTGLTSAQLKPPWASNCLSQALSEYYSGEGKDILKKDKYKDKETGGRKGGGEEEGLNGLRGLSLSLDDVPIIQLHLSNSEGFDSESLPWLKSRFKESIQSEGSHIDETHEINGKDGFRASRQPGAVLFNGKGITGKWNTNTNTNTLDGGAGVSRDDKSNESNTQTSIKKGAKSKSKSKPKKKKKKKGGAHDQDKGEDMNNNNGDCLSLNSIDSNAHQNHNNKISQNISPVNRSATADADFNRYYEQQRVYMFSLDRGHLLLRPEVRNKHGIKQISLEIPITSTCLGPPLLAQLLNSAIGYDTVTIFWALQTFQSRGYLYNSYSKQLLNLKLALPQPAPSDEISYLGITRGTLQKAAFKLGTVGSTIFLFFSTSSLVSFTLRETQVRMLRFTYLLQHAIRNSLPFYILILTHITETMVFVPVMAGILFFLREFFSDQLLAFMVLSLVWCAEVYGLISLRTMTSSNFFPRVFCIYLSSFLLYFFHFPCGFCYLAYVTTVLFTLHSMIYCMNTLEIPALECGVITVLNPREGARLGSISGNSHSHPRARADTGQTEDEYTNSETPRSRTSSSSSSSGSGSRTSTSTSTNTNNAGTVLPESTSTNTRESRTPERVRRMRAGNELVALHYGAHIPPPPGIHLSSPDERASRTSRDNTDAAAELSLQIEQSHMARALYLGLGTDGQIGGNRGGPLSLRNNLSSNDFGYSVDDRSLFFGDCMD